MPTMTRTSRAVRVLAPLLLTAALAGCGLVTADPAALAGDPSPVMSSTTKQSQWVTPTPTSSASSPTPATAAETVDTGQAVTALAELPVKGRASKGGYSRDQFGQAWADTDRNGCDQRNDVLRRDLTDKVLKSDTGGCVVLTGMFADPYSGRDIAFERGSDSADVQIDHVVALMDAWQSGAQQWTLDQRTTYANDPLVLMAADGPLNAQKGASNAASWLPPNKAFRCEYVARQVAIKKAYGLWVTRPEHDAIARVLKSCPDQELPTPAQVATPKRDTSAPSATQSAPAPTTKATTPAGGDVFYANCTEVRAAGADPIRRGEPGWQNKFDRDGDGIACK